MKLEDLKNNKKYEIIYCDPPWDYKGQVQTGKGGVDSGSAQKHYPCMKLRELKKLPVSSLTTDDALLFMWVTNPHLDQGIELLKSWGFKYATVAFVWDKQRVNPGFYTMSQCELCLVGKKGKIPQPRGARNMRQLVSEMRTKHSTKPAAVRTRIDLMFPTQSKVELFARQAAAGWDRWGFEAPDE